jgi:hypothetical protein
MDKNIAGTSSGGDLRGTESGDNRYGLMNDFHCRGCRSVIGKTNGYCLYLIPQGEFNGMKFEKAVRFQCLKCKTHNVWVPFKRDK